LRVVFLFERGELSRQMASALLNDPFSRSNELEYAQNGH